MEYRFVPCAWCNAQKAQQQFKTVNGKLCISYECFCSKKCLAEYSEHDNPLWIDVKDYHSSRGKQFAVKLFFLIAIATAIVLFIKTR